MKLDLFWRKAPVTLKWKLRVLDAVIHSKIFCGMAALIVSQSDYDNIDAFQVRIFRTTLNIKLSFWSHVTNDTVMNTANNRAQNIDKTIDITPLSFKPKQIIIKFYGHIIRSDPDTYQMQAISIDEDGNIISAPKPWRSGRPKLKWHDTARPLVIQFLEKLNILILTWRTDFSQYEVNQHIINAAVDRQIKPPLHTTQPKGFIASSRASQPSLRALTILIASCSLTPSFLPSPAPLLPDSCPSS